MAEKCSKVEFRGVKLFETEMNYSKKNTGFTLIELMIVVAVVGILAAIAYPSYTEYAIRTRRAVAAACLGQMSQAMERTMTTSLTYTPGGVATVPVLGCVSDVTGFYTFAFSTANTNAAKYQIDAAPAGSQVADTLCDTLSITEKGEKKISSLTGTVQKCWR